MMGYMLDTNTCIHLMKHRPQALRRRLSALPLEDVAISSVVVAELWYGVALSRKKKENEVALREFLDYVEVMDWPSQAGPLCGRIRSDLKRRDTPIGAMDLLIAAHTLFLDAVLVTDNTKEFERVPGLNLENWLES